MFFDKKNENKQWNARNCGGFRGNDEGLLTEIKLKVEKFKFASVILLC